MSIPVSVVIPAFNRSDTVDRAVASVKAQTLSPRQILVVDDCSTDDTASVAEAAGAEVLRLAQNGGAARARNQGMGAATQPWIAFLDSDDEWLPHHLSTLWPLTKSHMLVSGGRTSPQEGARDLQRRIPHSRSRAFTLSDPAKLVFPDNSISIGATLLSKAVVEEIGGFDETLRISEDLDLWVRVIEKYPALIISEPLYVYHLHEGQKTRNAEAARAAQIALLARYRSEAWWDENAFQRRIALNHAEVLILDDMKLRAAGFVLLGLLRSPGTYGRVAKVLALNTLAARRARWTAN